MMKITALLENISECELKAKHGLSLYIETKNRRILFDLGSDRTFFENAKTRGIDLTTIDTVIISHGHMDHGGALKHFLEINSTAKIYIQRKAFEAHYSKALFLKVNVGIDNKLINHPQVVLLDGDSQIHEELWLFTVDSTDKYYSTANYSLDTENGRDDFSHEQNLIIKDDKTVLITGCGHTGIVNILEKAKLYHPEVCIGGYHLYNPITKKTVSEDLLKEIMEELQKYNQMQYYTYHCTGQEAFKFFSKHMSNMHYLSCGKTIEID